MDITFNHYKEYKPTVLNAIQRISADDPEFYIDEFKAFDRLAFDLFSDAPEDRFVFTDGANDQGIDFYTEHANDYEIFQCKFSQLDTLLESNSPINFDASGVMELENAYKYLFENQVSDTAKKEIKQLRGNIIAQPCESICFNLCVLEH